MIWDEFIWYVLVIAAVVLGYAIGVMEDDILRLLKGGKEDNMSNGSDTYKARSFVGGKSYTTYWKWVVDFKLADDRGWSSEQLDELADQLSIHMIEPEVFAKMINEHISETVGRDDITVKIREIA